MTVRFLPTRILLLLGICPFFSVQTHGQSPQQLTDPTNQWYEYGQMGGWFGLDLQKAHYFYFFDGDTAIGANVYRKLYFEGRDSVFTNPPQYDTFAYELYYYNYSGAFRQDGQKVWFIRADSQEEHLYCDFEMAVGDTLKYYYGAGEIVTAIDSIPFGTAHRKRYTLNNAFSFYAGIGHVLGMYQYALGIEGGVYLTCFQQGGIVQSVSHFPSQVVCPWETTTSVTDIPAPSFAVDAYPNPFTVSTTIVLGYKGEGTIELLDMNGRIIRSIPNNGHGRTQIERQNLKAGMYTLRSISDRHGVATMKLVVE